MDHDGTIPLRGTLPPARPTHHSTTVAHEATLQRPMGQATGMEATRSLDVVVIGAGIAGLSAARALARSGLDVVVLEKSRGFGGRAASRTHLGVRFDHGAQFVTVRDDRFQRQVDAWLADGSMAVWTHGTERWTAADGWQRASQGAHPRYTCPAGMNALGKALAAGLSVERGTLVRQVRRDGASWHVASDDGRAWRAARVVISAPVPQALALLDTERLEPSLVRELSSLEYDPCHALIAHYASQPQPTFKAVQLPEHPDVAWVANDTSRRAQSDDLGATIVVHATTSFTRAHFDASSEEVAAALLAGCEPFTAWPEPPTWTLHHRWRYAQPTRTWPSRSVDLAEGLSLCGDAFGDGRVEGAYLSGLAAAASG